MRMLGPHEEVLSSLAKGTQMGPTEARLNPGLAHSKAEAAKTNLCRKEKRRGGGRGRKKVRERERGEREGGGEKG